MFCERSIATTCPCGKACSNVGGETSGSATCVEDSFVSAKVQAGQNFFPPVTWGREAMINGRSAIRGLRIWSVTSYFRHADLNRVFKRT